MDDPHRQTNTASINDSRDEDDGPSACKKPATIILFGVTINIHSKNPTSDGNIIDHEPQADGNLINEEVNPVPQLFNPRIHEQHPVLLFEKELEFSDINSNLNRLLIIESDKLMAALREEEQKKVHNADDKSDYLRVVTTDPRGEEYILHLKRWPDLGKLVLIHQWRKFVEANALHEGDSVQAWGYRLHDEFRLALHIVRA